MEPFRPSLSAFASYTAEAIEAIRIFCLSSPAFDIFVDEPKRFWRCPNELRYNVCRGEC